MPAMSRIKTAVALLAGLTAAVVWAVGMAVYQPIMEPHGVWTDQSTGQTYPALASNNTYWPRDLRLLAVMLAVAAVILLGRGARRGLFAAASLGVLWVAADVVFDRLQVHGQGTAIWLTGGAILVFAVAAALGWTRADGNETARRVVAAVASVLACDVLLVVSPWDPSEEGARELRIETQMWWLRAPLILMLLAVVVCLAASRSARRWHAAAWAAPYLILFGLVTAAAAVTNGGIGFGALSLSVLAPLPVVAAHTRSAGRVGLNAAVNAAVLVPLVIVAYFACSPLSRFLTHLAGNPPVNSADTDSSYALFALVSGIAFSVLGWWITSTRRSVAFGTRELPTGHGSVAAFSSVSRSRV